MTEQKHNPLKFLLVFLLVAAGAIAVGQIAHGVLAIVLGICIMVFTVWCLIALATN